VHWPASELEPVTVLKRILTAIRHPVSQNVIGLYAMQIAQFIVPLVTLPYVARVLEPSAFGLVVFSQGFAFVLVAFVNWGFVFTATRSVAEKQTDPDGLSHVVQRVRGAQLLLSAVSVPIALAALTFIPKMTQHPEFLVLAWVAAVATGLTPGWFFVGIEKPRLIALIQLGVRVLGAALTFVLVKGPGDAWIIMALFAASCLAGWVPADAMMYRRVKFRRPQLRASVTELRDASTIFMGMIAATLYSSFNVVLLGLFRPSADVAHFGAAERPVRVALTLFLPIGVAVIPRLMALQAEGRRERARELLTITMAVAAVPALLIVAGLELLAPTIIGVVYGDRFVDASVPILRVLSLIMLLGVVGGTFGTWLITQHKDRVVALIAVRAGILNVVLGTVLTLSFGPIGMAWSVLAAEGTVALGAFLAVSRGSRAGIGRRRLSAGLALKARRLGAVETVLIVILIPLLVILSGRFLGNGGENSSQQSPHVVFEPPASPVVGIAQQEGRKAQAAALRENHGKSVKEEGLAGSRSSSGRPRRSAPQPADAGGRAPAAALPPPPPPAPPPAPSRPVPAQPPDQPSSPSSPSTPAHPTGKPVDTPGNGPGGGNGGGGNGPDGTGPPGQQ
jgi:PST family polysaccharide transporter